MTLHEAIEKVIKEYGPMQASEISDAVYRERLYMKQDGGKAQPGQIRSRVKNYPDKFVKLPDGRIGLKGGRKRLDGVSNELVERTSVSTFSPAKRHSSRENSDESCVIGLCDKVLGAEGDRQYKFDFLRGDGNPGKPLPVDAYYPIHNLVIEYYEKQHTESVGVFNKPMTVSGVNRDEQRRIYDERRKTILPQHGIYVVTISYSDFEYDSRKRILRNRERDEETVRSILSKYVSVNGK